MKLYLTVIGIAMAVIATLNIAFQTASWYYVTIAVIWCTALQFVFDGAFAILINKLPNSWFSVDNKYFNVSKKERSLYKKLKVNKWKDKVWELGGLGGFSKKELKEPKNPEYIERFIIECNKGVVTHRIGYFVGFLAMLTLNNICSFTIALPVALVNLVLNIMPTIILRENTPKLKTVLEYMKRKKAKEENKAA